MKKVLAIITPLALIGGMTLAMINTKTEEGAFALIVTTFTIGAIVTKLTK